MCLKNGPHWTSSTLKHLTPVNLCRKSENHAIIGRNLTTPPCSDGRSQQEKPSLVPRGRSPIESESLSDLILRVQESRVGLIVLQAQDFKVQGPDFVPEPWVRKSHEFGVFRHEG